MGYLLVYENGDVSRMPDQQVKFCKNHNAARPPLNNQVYIDEIVSKLVAWTNEKVIMWEVMRPLFKVVLLLFLARESEVAVPSMAKAYMVICFSMNICPAAKKIAHMESVKLLIYE